MNVRNSYSSAKGHGYTATVDGTEYPWAKTEVGAKRIASRWINSGLDRKFVEMAIGCGWSVKEAQRIKIAR